MNFILPLFCFLTFFCYASDSKSIILQKLKLAKPGDYIVYEEGKSIHLLSLNQLDHEYAVFEEIVAPKTSNKQNWDLWAQKKAPGHTSWMMLEVHLSKLEITECFSWTKNAWLNPTSSESLIHQMLTLHVQKTPAEDRKKVGAAPLEGPDVRKIWHPPIFVHGNLLQRASTQAYEALWPEDGSMLSGKTIELYFYEKMNNFPFPHWIEIKDASRAYFKLRAIDSGHDFLSPYEGIPRRMPEFVKTAIKNESTIEFPLRIPLYYSGLHFFAIDESKESLNPIEIPFEKVFIDKELCHLVIKVQDLETILCKAHKYMFFLTVEKPLPACIDAIGKIVWQ
ncbi:MAG: hypothetical protein FJZ56_01960 [Chlamydiae bacterium]|nr:hypothetical protein [Chlamydiota bacterium]